jgi:hypothetical protein
MVCSRTTPLARALRLERGNQTLGLSRNTWIAEAIAEKLRRNAAPPKKSGANDA